MTDQLDRIEAKLDRIDGIVNQHVGVIGAVKWMLAGVGAGCLTLLGMLGVNLARGNHG